MNAQYIHIVSAKCWQREYQKGTSIKKRTHTLNTTRAVLYCVDDVYVYTIVDAIERS